MKKFTKLLGIVLIIALVMSMGTMALADNTYKITITANADNDKHTYEAYQIITGDLDTDENSDTKGQLLNLAWGNGVVGANLLNALKADATIGAKFADCDATVPSVAAAMAECTAVADVEALAAVIGAYVTSANLTPAGTSDENVISGLAQGYYFVKDISTGLTNDTKSEYMLQVVGDVTVTAKDSTVSLEKKVDDKNDSSTVEDAIAWQDTADYDVGDTIPYRLKGTLPSNYDKYDFFDYAFSDTMSAGLTLKADSVKVVYYANEAALTADTNATGGTDITNMFTISPDADAAGATLSVSIASAFDDDGKVTDAGLKKIVALTKDSVIVVYYTATLNNNAVIGADGNPNTAKLTFSNNPNATGEGDNTKSETPEDKNIVFTYKVAVDKVDENGYPLAGATFALYKEVADQTLTDAKTGKAIKEALGTTVEASALDDSKYYVEVGTVEATADNSSGTTAYTAGFERIDDGNYVLVETVVPDGYNAWKSTAFVVSATHTQDDGNPTITLTELTGGDLVSGDFKDTGVIKTDIENNSGVVLPSTGGIGTTVFYVVGSILVVAAGVLLITKKRMSREG